MTFDSVVERAAQGFIKSVMVVDDRASLDMASTPAALPPVVTPGKRGLAAAEDTPAGDSSAVEPEATSAGEVDLDGVELTRQFAVLGVACSIYKPTDATGKTEDINNTALVARHADVVVLDWQIGANSSEAREILKRIVAEDRKEQGRLRLIAIYTSEPNLQPILETVRGDLLSLNEQPAVDAQASRPTLLSGALGVIFVSKARGSAVFGTGVTETDLPGEVVRAFARLSRGVVPAVALAAISAVRKSTHHVLARFHARLDPALATHRSLLKHPEDAESFVAELVADELKSIIEASRVGFQHSNVGVWRSWIESFPSGNGEFKEKADSIKGLGKDGAANLLEKGQPSHEELGRTCDPVIGKNRFPLIVPNFFSANAESATRANLELARLSVLKREAHSNSWLPTEWRPNLTLGTIVARGGNRETVFACIQPVCDAVRIDGQRRFPFVPLRLSAERFSLVVRFADGSDACYEPDHSLFQLEHHTFSAETSSRTVIAERRDGQFWFNSVNGPDYEWLADMRQPMATRLAQQWAIQADRIGLDDYEWLRQRAK